MASHVAADADDKAAEKADEDDFWNRATTEARAAVHTTPARYDEREIISLTRALHEFHVEGKGERPILPTRSPHERHYAAPLTRDLPRAKPKSKAAEAAREAAAAERARAEAEAALPAPAWHRSTLEHLLETTGPELPTELVRHTIQIPSFTPNPEAVEFVRAVRLEEPRTFIPERDDAGEDASPDPGVARARFPLPYLDAGVYLKTSNGDHSYYVRLPDEPGREMRKRRADRLGVPSVSGLAKMYKGEGDFPGDTIAARCAGASHKRFREHFHLDAEESRQLLAEAHPRELEAWGHLVGGHFEADEYKRDWQEASARGTRVHRALELYLNGHGHRVTGEDTTIMEALRKFHVLRTTRMPYLHPKYCCRTELNLFYEPLDLVGQLDALIFVPGYDDVVDVLDWKCINAKTMAELLKKLRDYEPQLMMYAYMMRFSPEAKLRALKIRKLILVALPPDNSVTDEAVIHEFAYDPQVVEGMLKRAQSEVLKKLRERWEMATRPLPSTHLEQAVLPPPQASGASKRTHAGERRVQFDPRVVEVQSAEAAEAPSDEAEPEAPRIDYFEQQAIRMAMARSAQRAAAAAASGGGGAAAAAATPLRGRKL